MVYIVIGIISIFFYWYITTSQKETYELYDMVHKWFRDDIKHIEEKVDKIEEEMDDTKKELKYLKKY